LLLAYFSINTTVSASPFWHPIKIKIDKSTPAAKVPANKAYSRSTENTFPRDYGKDASGSKLLHTFGFCNLGTPESIMLGVAITVAYTRVIPVQDILFSIAFPIYIGVINRIRFQRNQAYFETKKPTIQQPTPLLWHPRERGPWFKTYLFSFAFIGIMLPTIFLFSASMPISSPAVPHTYLVLMQVVTEGLSAGPYMHILPKLLIPIGFNAYRIMSLWSWVKLSGLILEHTYAQTTRQISPKGRAMIVIGFFLGVANFLIWAYNLLVFLLLRATPQFLDTTTFPTAQVQWKLQLWPVPSGNGV
jgi:hypothetical protein